MKADYKYYAFISYKREDKDPRFKNDEKWANIVYKLLRAWDIPVVIQNEPSNLVRPTDKTIDPVFLDKTRMNGAGTVEKQLTSHLSVSKCLVVICSRNMIEDERTRQEKGETAYVFNEIRDFLASGNGSDEDLRNRVILLWIDDKPFNPDTDVPPPFDGSKKAIIVNEYRKDTNEKGNLEQRVVSEIAASIFNVDRIVFWDSFLRGRIRRKRIIASIIVAAIVVFSVLLFALNANKAQLHLSAARRSLSEGNRRDAMTLAIRAYNKWHDTPDLTQFMWTTLDPKEPFMSFESEVAVSKIRNEFAAIRDNQYVDIYDGASLNVIKTYDVGHGGSLVYSPNGDKLSVYTNNDISVLDRTTDDIVHNHESIPSQEALQFSPDGEYIFSPNWGIHKSTDMEEQYFPTKLPHHWSSYSNSSVSFLGTNNKVALINHVFKISGGNTSGSLWTINIFNISNKNDAFYYEFPDSVSFVHAYSDKSIIFSAGPRGISFMRYDNDSLTNVGWIKYDRPVKQWRSSDNYADWWCRQPYKINKVSSSPSDQRFVLHTNREVAFSLDSQQRIETVVSARVIEHDVYVYKGDILAVGDSLTLVSDNYGRLFLLDRIDPNIDRSLNVHGGIPLYGCFHNEGCSYSIARLRNFQFVSQSQQVVSGKQTKTLMYWEKDTREVPTISFLNNYWCRYTSPDLSFALVSTSNQFGVLNIQTKEFIPVCPRFPQSGSQDLPLYVSDDGRDVFVLSATEGPATILFNLVQVNLFTKETRVLIEGMESFSKLSDGVVLGQSKDRTCLVNLRQRAKIAQYDGWLDIENINGLYSVTRRKYSTENSWSNELVQLLYDDSSATLKEIAGANRTYSSSHGHYYIEVKYEGGVIAYTLFDFNTHNYIVTLRGEGGDGSFCGMTNNERYFIYNRYGCLSICDFKKQKKHITQHKIHSANKGMLTLANSFLFFPGNTNRIIDLDTGKMLMSIPELEFANKQVAFSPDEKWLLAGRYLVSIKDRQIISDSILYGYNRSLTNERIVYMNKSFPLPQKKALAKQITSILEDQLKPRK